MSHRFHGARTLLARGTLGGWAALCLVVGAYQLASHVASLPTPAQTDPKLVATVSQLRAADDRGKWMAIHFVYQDCACSTNVLDHLLARDARPDLAERIVYVTAGSSDGYVARGHTARARGYKFDAVDATDLAAKYHVEAAPVMVLADPEGKVRYLGGYTDRKQSVVVHDLDTVRRVRAGESVAPLPVFGCAVSESLRTKVDPLGVR